MSDTNRNNGRNPQKVSRKTFLKQSAMAAVGTSLFRSLGLNADKELPRVALQLYTVRNQIADNLPETLQKISDIGIQWVETAFWPSNISLKEAAEQIKKAGLKVCSCHVELPTGDKKDAMLQTAAAFDCKKMIWHGWPEDKRYSSMQGTLELAGLYNESNHFAKSNGLQFGLHNHWWEYRNRVDGKLVYEVLLEHVEPDIFFEIDTYWVKVAGQDPAQKVAEFGSRAPFLHIKDGPAKWSDSLPADNPDPMVAVGKGAQDFPSIVKAAHGNTRWMIIEMDKTATDVFAAIRESYAYLTKNGFAK